MKTVLSNAKKYLSVLLAMAMIVLSIPNAPVTVLAATGNDSATESIEPAEGTEVASEAEPASSEEVVEPASSEEVAEPAPVADQVTVDTAAQGTGAEEPTLDSAAAGAEEEIKVHNASLGFDATGNGYVLARPDKTGTYVSDNCIYLAAGATTTAYASASSNFESKSDFAPIGDKITWKSSNTDVVTVAASPTDDQGVVITAVAPGEATIEAEWADSDKKKNLSAKGSNALKVTVVGLEVSKNTGTVVDDAVTLDLVTVSANVPGGETADKLQEKVVYQVVTKNGTAVAGKTVTWNVVQTVNASANAEEGVVTYNETGFEGTLTASENDGSAKVTAVYEPDGASGRNFTVAEDTVYVDNKTVQVVLTDENGKALPEKNATHKESFTNLEGATLSENMTLDQRDHAIYTLSAKDELGNAAGWVTGYTVSFNNSDPINVQVSGNSLKVSADEKGAVGEYAFSIYALGKTNNVKERLLGIISGTVTVEASESFGFVSNNSATTNLGSTERVAFLSRVTANQKGGYVRDDDLDDFSKVTLYTQVSSNRARTWKPLDVKNSITSNAVTGNWTGVDDVTKNQMIREYFIVTGNDETVFGPQTVTASIKTAGDEVKEDSFTLNVIGVAGAKTGEEAKELSVSDNNLDKEDEYEITLGILAASQNITDNSISTNVARSAKKDEHVIYASVSTNDGSDAVVYQTKSYDGKVVKNMSLQESATLSILGAAGGSAEIVGVENLTANGVASVQTIVGNEVTENYEVIECDGLKITAMAPGTARVYVSYTDEAKNTWTTPVNVTVKDLFSSLASLKVTMNADPATIMVGGETTLKTKVTGADGIEVPSSIAYKVNTVTMNGKAQDDLKALASFSGDTLKINDPEGLITKEAEFGITATATPTIDGAKKATSKELTVKVIPQTSVDLAFVTENYKDQFLFVGEEKQTVSFKGDAGLGIVLTGSAHDENVVKAEVEKGKRDVVLTPVSAGTTTVTVSVPGTSASKEIAVSVYDVEATGDAALTVSDNGERLLTYQVIGTSKPSSTLSVYTVRNGVKETEDVTWDLSKIGSDFGATTSSAAGTATVTSKGTVGDGSITAALKGRDDKRIDQVAKVLLAVDEVKVTVEKSENDKNVKIITAETSETASDWTLTPVVTFKNSKEKEISAPVDYTLSCNMSDKTVVDVSLEDGKFIFTPKKFGSTDVTLKVLSGSDELAVATGVVRVDVAAKLPFVSDNGKVDAITSNADMKASDLYVFTNYAVTSVDEDGVALAQTYEPTLSDAVLCNVKDMEFNTGWSWGNQANVKIKNLSSTSSTKVPAVYTIDGVVVGKVEVPVKIASFDGILLSGNGVEPTDVANVYKAKLVAPSNVNEVQIDPVMYYLDGESISASDKGFFDLYGAHTVPTVTVENTKIARVLSNSITADAFNINTTSTAGEAVVYVNVCGYDASINVATAKADDMVSMNFASSNTGLGNSIDPDYAFASGATRVFKPDTFFIDYDSYIGTPAHIYLAVTQNGKESPLETDSTGAGIITITSSDTDVAVVNKATMTRTKKVGEGSAVYDVYEATVEPKGLGVTTIEIVASDAVATTLRANLFVVGDAEDVTVDDVTVSNVKVGGKYNVEELTFNFPANTFFDCGAATATHNGYAATTINIAAGNEDGYFTITSNKGGSLVPTITITNGKTVEPGIYTLKLSGTAALQYEDKDRSQGETTSVSFKDKTLNVTVSDVAELKANDVNATITQNSAMELDAAFNTSGYTVDKISFTDASAAAAAGLSIVNNTLYATATAELGLQNFPITIEGHKTTDSTEKAYADASLIVTVLSKGDVAVEIAPITVARGEKASLSATWLDGKTRTNTFSLVTAVDGFSIENGALVVHPEVVTGVYNLQIAVEGKASDGDDAKATVNAAVTVTDISFDVDIRDFSIKRGGSKVITTSSITDGFTAYAFEPIGDYTGLVMNADGKTLSALEGAKDTYTLDFTVYAKRNSDGAEVSATVGDVVITVRDSGADQHTDEKPEDASDEMTVNYIMPDLTYDGTAKTLQNLQVFWNGKLLTLNKDYSVKYANNKNVGTGTCTITGKGSYQQAMTIKMPIVARDISESGDFGGEFTAESVTVKSADKVSSAKIKLYWNGKAMKATGNTPEYTAQIGTYVKADGRAEVTIKGVGNFTGEKTAYVYVLGTNKDAKTLTVSFTKKANEMVVGKGGTMYPAFTVKGGGSQKFAPDFVDSTSGQVPKEGTITVAEGKTIEYHFEGGDRAGKSYLVIEVQEPTQIGTQTYLGNKTQVYTIKSDMKFTKDNVKLVTPEADLYYNGLAKTVEVEIKDGDEMLDEGVDYVITYRNNIKAGNATATVTGLGAYAGNKYNLTFKILKPTVVLKLWGDTAPITKGGATPSWSISLMNGDTEVDMLSSYYGAADWTYSYKNNKTVGETATMTVKGKANVQGTSSATYKVTEAEFNYDVWPSSTVQDVKYTEKALADIKAGKKNPKITLYGKNLTINRDYTVESWDFSSDTWDAETGYIDVDVTIKGAGDYTGTATLRAFHIYAGDAAHKISTKNWKVKETLVYPDEALSVEDIDAGDMEGKYTILTTKSGKPNAKSATYTITVRGEGAYGGTATFRYQVLPADIHAAE